MRGEGEQTMAELAELPVGQGHYRVPGIAFRDGTVRFLKKPRTGTATGIRFLYRPGTFFPTAITYKIREEKIGIISITSVMIIRGCPFACEFGRAVFGVSYRGVRYPGLWTRSSRCSRLGYDRIHFADDVFTLKKESNRQFLGEVLRRRI